MTRAARFLCSLTVALALAGCTSFGAGSILDLAVGSATGDRRSQEKVNALKQASEDTKKASEEFTPEQKYYIGRAVAATILGDSAYPPYEEPRSRDYLNLLGTSLAWSSPRPETFAGWHVLVLDTDEINAFGAPEGFILVSRGLLRCAGSEDEVAAIVAHEIGHVVLEHGVQAIDAARKAGAVASIAKAGLLVAGSATVQKLTSEFGDVVGDVMKTLVNKGYSRDLEYSADAFAVGLLARTGYDPRALVRMLEVMQSKWKANGPGFMKTHPSPADRIAAVEKALAGTPPSSAASAAERNARASRYRAALGGI